MEAGTGLSVVMVTVANPFPAAAQQSCVENKANGQTLHASLAAIEQETLDEMKALRKTTFVFKPPEEQYERELHIFAEKVREDEVLKPIIERIVSIAEPDFPLAPEMERQSYLLAVTIIAGWWDLTHMAAVGNNWSAAVLQSRMRGRVVRRIMAEVWVQARAMARAQKAREEAAAAAAREERERAMQARLDAIAQEAREAALRASTAAAGSVASFMGGRDVQQLFAPLVVGAARPRQLLLGLPDAAAHVVHACAVFRPAWQTAHDESTVGVL